MSLQYLLWCFWNSFVYIEVNTERVFELESSDFNKIISTSAFVDKTSFIKEILDCNKSVVITAPFGFGKTTNLNMLKTFLEVEVYYNGKPKTKVNYLVNMVKDTPNYHMFVDKKLKISKNLEIMNEYLGRFPVMSLSLRCDRTIKSLDDALSVFRLAVHNTYREYRYLAKSDHLRTHMKQYIETWCDDRNYNIFSEDRIISSLRELSECLFYHFNERRVFVLIDDHDSVLWSAILNGAGENELEDIAMLCVSVVNDVLGNNKYVQAGVITGVIELPACGPLVDSFPIFRFLGDHQFVDYYGLTKQEVNELFVWPEHKLWFCIVEEAQVKYNGYKSKSGKEIYNLYSLLNFLKSGQIQNYWTAANNISYFNSVLTIPTMRENIEKLLLGETINIVVPEKLTIRNIVDLRNILFDPKRSSVPKPDMIFRFLLDQGYLTYAPQHDYQGQAQRGTVVKIPNSEIKEVFIDLIK